MRDGSFRFASPMLIRVILWQSVSLWIVTACRAENLFSSSFPRPRFGLKFLGRLFRYYVHGFGDWLFLESQFMTTPFQRRIDGSIYNTSNLLFAVLYQSLRLFSSSEFLPLEVHHCEVDIAMATTISGRWSSLGIYVKLNGCSRECLRTRKAICLTTWNFAIYCIGIIGVLYKMICYRFFKNWEIPTWVTEAI